MLNPKVTKSPWVRENKSRLLNGLRMMEDDAGRREKGGEEEVLCALATRYGCTATSTLWSM